MAQPTDWYALLDEADQKRCKPKPANSKPPCKPESANTSESVSTNELTGETLTARIEALEAELKMLKAKARKEYQREYMRRKRAEDSNTV